MINPRLARSQIVGGMLFGFSMALMEGTIPDETTGRIVNANLADYHVAVHADTPEFDIDFLNHVIRICLTSARAVLVKSESWARRLRSRTRFLTQLENECAICRSHRTS